MKGKERLEQFGFRRRVEMTIEIGADSWDEFTMQLREIERTLSDERTGHVSIVSGGCNSGYTVEGDVDPEWTAERSADGLERWMESRAEGKEDS